MNFKLKCALGLSAVLLTAQAMAAQITFYEGEGFRGRSYTTTGRGVEDFRGSPLNDRASSVVVGSGDWEVCDGPAYSGRCVLLHPGAYESLSRLRMDNRISSVRRTDNRRAYDKHFVPEPYNGAMYEYRQRPGERLYEARVTDVRAVNRSERCWVERDQVDERSRSRAQENNVGAKVAGAIVGGILGHQVGKGGAAITAGGAVAGGAVASRLAHDQDRRDERDDDIIGRRDVRHCDSRLSGPPDFWDVSYVYNGVEHHVQMDAPPGRTVWVNGRGEPRQ